MAPATIASHPPKEVPVDLSELQLTTVGLTDPAQIARISDQRWRLRRARIMADPHMSAAMKEWYLDRTIWNTETAAEKFGWNGSSVRKLRVATVELGGWSPSAYPDLDNAPGQADAGVEAGRLREWAEWRGSHDVDPDTGDLIKRPPSRHGRARADRGARTKSTYSLGTPRAGKKNTRIGPAVKYTPEHVTQLRTLVDAGKDDTEIAKTIGAPFLDRDGNPDPEKVQRLRWKHRIARSKKTRGE